MIIGAEVDESAHRAFRADNLADDEFVESVLHGHHAAIVSEAIRQGQGRFPGMLSLGAEQDYRMLAFKLIRQRCGRAHREVVHRAGNAQAVSVYRIHMVFYYVDEVNIVTCSNQISPDCAADGASAPK